MNKALGIEAASAMATTLMATRQACMHRGGEKNKFSLRLYLHLRNYHPFWHTDRPKPP